MDKTKKQGLLTLFATIAIQLCIGMSYLWSVFQTGIADTLFDGDNSKSSLVFALQILMLSFGGVFGGKMAAKYSTRLVVIISAILIGSGFFFAAFVTPSTSWLLWITAGVMVGFGIGCSYSTSIALAQKWFPTKKGLITGVVVAAMGFGGVVFTPVLTALIDVFGGVGVGEQQTFLVVAAIFIVVLISGSFFMKTPPPLPTSIQTTQSLQKNYSTLEMIKSPKFYLITVAFLLATMGGLMMLGFAKPIAEGKGFAEMAAAGVIIVSLLNSIGRLTWGAISDKLGKINTLLVLLVGSALMSFIVIYTSGAWIFVVIGLIGFFYGGILSTFPTLTAETFGAKNVGVNYGVVLSGFGIGGVISSQIAGHYKNIAVDDINLMAPAFIIAGVCALVGTVMLIILQLLSNKEKAKQATEVN